MSTDFLSLPGAVGETVPRHYGNPIGEQRALAAGRAIVDLSDRAVLSVTGPDRLSWLNSITSQELGRLQPGDSAETLVLGVTGRLEHAARVLDDGVSTWLLVDEASALEAFLQSMRFMLRVQIEDRTAEYATIGTFGEGLVTAAAPNDVPLEWVDPWRQVVVGGHQYALTAEHPAAEWTYREVLVAREALASLTNLPVAGTLALEALRIAAWRPRFTTEVDEKTIPHELDWLRSAVHLNKGCYRGQETVAKVHNLGHPPRRLVMLHLDGTDAVLPEPGDQVLDEDTTVGYVTSVGIHHELGPIALSVIRRTVDPAHPLTVRTGEFDIAAAQEVIVPPSAGAEANVPRLPRLGAVTRPQR